MQSETLFTTGFGWQNSGFVAPACWAYNDPLPYTMDTQSFAPGNHPAQLHYTGGAHMPQSGNPSLPYPPHNHAVDVWRGFSRPTIHNSSFVGQEASIQQGHAVPGGHVPRYSLSMHTAMNNGPFAQHPKSIIPYGYESIPHPPPTTNCRSMPMSTNGHGIVGSGFTCNRCLSASAPLTPASRPSHTVLPPIAPVLARGPPRKPKRSGHAVWVGNIPMGASIEALKDHFSRDARNDIESLFLMAKSNCAFVNYYTEEACNAAVERFNHSLFGSVRLLCRIRREPGILREVSVSTGVSSTSSSPLSSMKEVSQTASDEADSLDEDFAGLGIGRDDHSTVEDAATELATTSSNKPTDRYFIVKSLTKEDLQNSLQTGLWETQSHNQKVFDNAFREAANVYMIFSVNKSGEYFGYARMLSAPHAPSALSPSASPTISPKQNSTLKITETASTATAPKGYVIDDTIRGTLFWEAEPETNGIVSSTPSISISTEHDGHVRSRPFQVEWLSVRRVTFQRTKGIRNPWNNNKEVKVARDGTELETEVGKKIVGLFHESYEDMAKRVV